MANRFLNNITINDEYTLPSVDGTAGQAITTDGAGNLSFATVDSDSALKIALRVKNVSGATLNAGTLVRVAPSASPPSGNVLEVNIADNSSASTMPAIGILTSSLANEAEGDAVAFGRASGFSTIGFTEGDPVWVGSNGALTGTKPIGSNLIQKVGQVIKVDSSNGSIEVFGAGRSNDVPNIPQDQLWLGNSSGVATPTAHTVENISNVTVSSKTDGQALVWDATNNYWKNGTVSGGGGGGGSMSAEINQYTGNGTTDTYSLTTAATDDDAVQVYLDGVYQVKTTANYSISGSTVTFVDPPTSGTAIEFVHFVNTSPSSLINKTFTASGTTADFDLVDTVSDENYTFVFIQGVYQEKSTYSITGSTLTFTTTPLAGYSIEVMIFGTVSLNNSGGISWDTTVQTSAFTATAGAGYFVNTTSGGVTVTLPTSPTAGDEVSIVDYAGTADTNNITITSTDNINGAGDVFIDYKRGGVSMVYVDATQGWIAYNANNETAESLVPDTISVDYLVVAGGGAGGMDASSSNYGGAGGAGGLRTSYSNSSSLNGHTETSLSLTTSTNYTVTVGAGGSGQDGDDRGNNGSSSVFATITSTGGGGGGTHTGFGPTSGKTGGSGGGGGFQTGGSSGGSAVTSPATQGYAGGAGSSTPNASGGGGGAGAVGGTQLSNNGGVGLAVNILNATNAASESVGEVSGSDVYYAGGGGGTNQLGDPVATGGLGGGGNGSTYNASNATSGDVNTGGGGGGGTSTLSGRTGGSGVVILRYPSGFSISETTSPTVLTFNTYTEGSDKVTVFTSGENGTIQFS